MKPFSPHILDALVATISDKASSLKRLFLMYVRPTAYSDPCQEAGGAMRGTIKQP